MMTRSMKMRTARKEATMEPLVRRQKPWNCMQMGTQLARRFPEWAKSTMAAAAAAAADSSATIICNMTSHN
jgi:hypothetical protein